MLREKLLTLAVMLLCTLTATAQFSVSLDGTDPTCNGFSNGTITATTTGGDAPFIYSYSNGFSGQTISGLSAGSYEVTVTDANNETATAAVSLNDPEAIEGNLSVDDVCSGNGNVSSAASGGVGGYTYAWTNGQTSANATGLTSGINCVTITDANGCQAVSCVTVFAPLTVDVSSSGLPCFDACDASVTATIMGGNGPYSFLWNTGSTASILEAVPAGTYSVTVTDNNGCTATGTSVVVAPDQIEIDVTVTNPQCGIGAVGSATASATGGTPPFQYFWSDGQSGPTASNLPPGNYNVVVTDANGCQEIQAFAIVPDGGFDLDISTTPTTDCGAADGTANVAAAGGVAPYTYLWSTGATTTTISGLTPGSYGVTVTDAEDCATVGMATVGGLTDITLNSMTMDPVCGSTDGGTAIAQPFGGTPPYTYAWSNGATSNVIGNLDPGNYTVTVTDAAGCTASVTLTINPASGGLNVSATSTGLDCDGTGSGSATATVNGGTAPFTYAWSNGGTTQTITDLSVGTYTVTVTDAEGCSGEATVTIAQSTINISLTTTDEACDGSIGGSASATVSGGTEPYSFAWSTGSTASSINDLVGGTYSLTVTDTDGCTEETTFEIAENGSLSCSVAITNPISTPGGNDGEATVTATGGAAPYTYLWSTGSTNVTATGLSAGTYTVTVTDQNNCTTTCSVAFQGLAKLGDRIFIDENRNGCQDADESGWFNLTVTLNGTDINGNTVVETTQTDVFGNYSFENLVPGNYTVQIEAPTGYIITDANQCGDEEDSDANPLTGTTGTYNLTAGECDLSVDIGIYDPCDQVDDPGEICCDQTLCGPGNTPDPITSIAPATGGSGNLEYLWMSSTTQGPFNPNTWTIIPGATGADYAPGPLAQTTYFARCARREGCVAFVETSIVTIEINEAFIGNINGPNLVCTEETVTFSTDLAGAGLTYLWNFGLLADPSTATTQSVDVTWDFVTTTNVTLTVTSDDCTSTTNLFIFVTDSPIQCGPGASNLIANVNDNGTVGLAWDYEAADPSMTFTVQRSENGVDFTDLAQMDAHDNSAYNYLDTAPMRGESFYRIMMQDVAGATDYSALATVEIANSRELFFLYPNPFTSELTISVLEELENNVQVNVFHPDGRVLRTFEMQSGNNGQQMNMEELAAGIYYVQFQFADGYRMVRVVKE